MKSCCFYPLHPPLSVCSFPWERQTRRNGGRHREGDGGKEREEDGVFGVAADEEDTFVGRRKSSRSSSNLFQVFFFLVYCVWG